MRDEYYNYCEEIGVVDYLEGLNDLSYSKKLKIVKELYEFFDKDYMLISYILYEYKLTYIDIDRVDFKKMVGQMKGIGRRKEGIK